MRDGNPVAAGVIELVIVAPGLFSANADGRDVAAAVVFRLGAGGTREL